MYAKNPLPEIQQFVKEQYNKIIDDPLGYEVNPKAIADAYENARRNESERLTRQANGVVRRQDLDKEADKTALRQIPQALRFLSFTLADYSNHEQAKRAAYHNNYYRMAYWKVIGRMWRYRVARLEHVITGYLERPLRVIGSALGVCFLYGALYGSITEVTARGSGDNKYSSIVFSSNIAKTDHTAEKTPVQSFPTDSTANLQTLEADASPNVNWYHYLYFSAVTLTTLGYGDLAPNHSPEHGAAEWIMVVLCASEAIIGYILLGIGVATLMRIFDAHPYGNMSRWMDLYMERLGVSPDQGR